MNTNWFEDLFIDEAKAAIENRGNSSGDSSGGVEINNQDKTITENGTYTADAGYTGLGTVEVNVPDIPAVLQDKTITENGVYTADSSHDGLGTVTVNIPIPSYPNARGVSF